MIKYLFLSIFIVANAFSAEKIHLVFKDPQVKQGSIVDATIAMGLEVAQKIGGPAKLKDSSLGDTFYIVNASTQIRKMDSSLLTSDTKIILQKIPESQPVRHNFNGTEVEVTWENVEFVPTEAAQGFIFGSFDIPARMKLLQWLIGLIVVAAIGLITFYGLKKFKHKKLLKQHKTGIKNLVMSANEYSDVVTIWQKKSLILKEFPQLEEHFRKLETVLFKYQFKPHQTETEKAEVMNAYRDFTKNVEGGFHGI